MSDKEPTSLGELWRLMDLKLDSLIKEIALKADKAVFDLTVKGLRDEISENRKDIESIRSTTKWAIGVSITLIIALVGIIAKVGVV